VFFGFPLKKIEEDPHGINTNFADKWGNVSDKGNKIENDNLPKDASKPSSRTLIQS